ncbi:hypothetical protein TYRP_009517 [Tyrophagus putrescentiae]|nr:hypothetical protein TYRP_009517 [Tyrophagus putrescentiae]
MKKALIDLSFLFLCSALFLALAQPSEQKNLDSLDNSNDGERHPISFDDAGLKEALKALHKEIFDPEYLNYVPRSAEKRTIEPVTYWVNYLRFKAGKVQLCEFVIEKDLGPQQYRLTNTTCFSFVGP